MRNNHDKKTHKLGKRTIALCLALAVICTCLVPVFATEGLSDPQPEQEVSRSAEGGEDEAAGFGGDEAAGFGGDEAAGFGGDEAAGFGGDEAARPVEGDGENPGEGGPTVTDSEWGTVIEYGTDSSTETQWSGEDDVVTKPDDEVVVSGDEIKELQDMVVYRFWLKELNTLDLQDITAQAQINEMTESEYLARYGEVLWNLYFIQAVPRAETIADYSSNIQTPSSNRDPEGLLRLFDYWYTLDEFGNRVRLDLTDPISNILDDKTTTVNVYAAWKDGTVGSDKEESVDHEDLVDKNPVPVDLETKASASYEDEDGNMKSVDLPVKVKNLPSAADHLRVSHMGDKSMQEFYESHLNELGKMAPILGLKISPKNAKGETVQPANGQKATVTVSGLEKLPEMEGATADTLKVFHETSDGNVEILDVLTYTNGTLTFETSSFSPFVVVRTDGYDTETLETKNGYEPLYLYLLKPQYVWDGSQVNSTDYWYGIGIAQVKTNGYKESSSVTDIKNRIDNQDLDGAIRLEPYSGSATIKAGYQGWEDYNASYSGLQLYPPIDPTTGEIVKDKNGNVVWNTTTGYRYWNGEGLEPTYKYYTIEWIHTGKTSGALANGYNYPEISGSFWSYHLDGRVHLSTTYNVDFKVKVPDSTTFEYLSDYSVLVNKGASESIITQPQNNKNKPYNIKQYENAGYVFNGWYKDEACTIKAEFDGTIVKDTTYYGKYVLKDTIEEDIPYITVEKQITGIGVKQIPFNFYVMVGDQKLEFQHATLVQETDPIILRWTIWNPTPQTYSITEGHETVEGYTVNKGGAYNQTVDVTEATFEVTGGEIIHQCSNLTLDIGQHGDDEFLFVVSANGNQSKNIVISKSPLSLTQREAVEKKLKDAKGAFGNQNEGTVYYSIKDKKEVVIDHVKLTYNESAGTITINGKNVWNMAMQLSYNATKGNNPEVKITNDYAPATANVTITKHVTGLLGDHNGEFSFTVSFAEGTDTANIQATKSGASTAVDDWHSFTLKDGETITFTGVPIGAVMTVTEIAPGKHYTVEATGQSDGKSGETDASFTYKIVAADAAATDTTTDAVTVANNAITITNDAKLTPDAGVILDTLPYIVILAVVVGGGVMLFLRKRRKDDED